MVLNSDEAVKAFSRGGNVTIGGSVSAAAGPIGTGGQINASLVNPAPIFSYSRSKGKSGFEFRGAFEGFEPGALPLPSRHRQWNVWRHPAPLGVLDMVR